MATSRSLGKKYSLTLNYKLTSYFIGIDDLNDVFQKCKHFSAKWDMIGLNLGVASTTIAIINRDNPNSCEQCMYEMLAKWLQRENGRCMPTWRSLCQSLEAEVGKSAAYEIAKKPCVTDHSEKKGTNHVLLNVYQLSYKMFEIACVLLMRISL